MNSQNNENRNDRHEHEWVPCDDNLICDGCGGIR